MSIFSKITDRAKSLAEAAQGAVSTVTGVIGDAGHAVSGAFEEARERVSEVMGGVADGAQSVVTTVTEAAAGAAETVTAAVGSAVTAAENVTSVVTNPIKSVWAMIVSFIRKVFSMFGGGGE